MNAWEALNKKIYQIHADIFVKQGEWQKKVLGVYHHCGPWAIHPSETKFPYFSMSKQGSQHPGRKLGATWPIQGRSRLVFSTMTKQHLSSGYSIPSCAVGTSRGLFFFFFIPTHYLLPLSHILCSKKKKKKITSRPIHSSVLQHTHTLALKAPLAVPAPPWPQPQPTPTNKQTNKQFSSSSHSQTNPSPLFTSSQLLLSRTNTHPGPSCCYKPSLPPLGHGVPLGVPRRATGTRK